MPKLTITFDDTDAMRDVLGQLAEHCHNDNIDFWESEAEETERNAKLHGDEDGAYAKAAAKAKRMAEANQDFCDTVTEALHPELRRDRLRAELVTELIKQGFAEEQIANIMLLPSWREP